MKKNKILVYLGILAVGLLLGWLLFGSTFNNEAEQNQNESVEANQMWTCSMHPSVMQTEPGDCPICGMDLIPAETGADGLAADQFKLTDNAIALANIQTTMVGNSEANKNTIKLSGKIAENEEANVVQVSYLSGRIERLNVSFTGEEINKGQLLATIYSPELYAAQQELITTASLKETQPQLYNAVRNKLKLWKLSESQINQIESTGKVQDNVPVYATVSGTVIEKLVEQGDYIKQGQPLLKIANLNTVWANLDVYENQIDFVKKGQEIAIVTNAYPNKTFKAKVDFIDPVLNTKTRTVTVRAVLNNKDDVFKPGMFVEGEIDQIMSTTEGVLTIPASAVLWTGERSVVYLKPNQNESVFQMRSIVIGNKLGDSYQVLEGLNIGDEIVTNGTFTVDAAAQLRGKKSMMNKDGAKVMTGHEDHLDMDESASKSKTDFIMAERIEVSKDFQNQLKTVYNNYIKLKDALVKDDANSVMEESKALLNKLSRVNMKLLTNNETNLRWMSLEKEIKASATTMSNTTDIKQQRNHFKYLSSNLINAVQRFGINEKVYIEFCPMADDNNGAYWLSKEEQILNPYFGDAMLKCGSVKQIID